MIAIIDYGMGNLKSVSKAFETIGKKVEVTNNPKVIKKAEAIILPGVGAFGRGMDNLKKLKLIPLIYEVVKEDKPILGICLGLQLLFTKSYEHGIHKGLDIIKGEVKRFKGVKIPHMGWNQVKIRKPETSAEGRSAYGRRNQKPELFKDIPDNSYFYFVHSYYVVPDDKRIISATTGYGQEFASAIVKDKIFGVQFHPEKSGESGLKFLENFCVNVS